MAKSKTYEMLLKIAGKEESSLKTACSAASKDLDSLGATAKKAAQVATTALAGVATAAAGVAAASLSAYSEFEQAMDSTAVTARATDAEYEAMEAAAREMGAKTTKTATEAAEAMGYMALAGWDVQDTIDGLEPILRLSEATQMDLATASDLVTDSMSALGLEVSDMTDYLNLAVQAQRVSNTTAEDLLEAFIGCGGAAKTAGVDMGDLSTALGVLANNGAKGSEAGTALNSMLARMTTNDAALSAFEKLGVAVYDDAGNFRGLETVLTDTSAAMAGLSDAERLAAMKSIAGTNYFTEMSYLLDAVADGADGAASAWSALEADMMDNSGVLLEVAQANTDNLAGATEIFKSAVSELQLQIGEQLAPYAKEALEYLTNNVLPAVSEKIGEIIPKVVAFGKALWDNKGTILTVASAVAAAAGAFKAMKTVSTAVSAVKNLSTVLGAASKGGKLLSKVMSVGNLKFLAIAAAIGAVVAVVILLVKNWDKIRAAALKAWEAIEGVWSTVADWFSAHVVTPLANFFSPIWEKIKTVFSELWLKFGGILTAMLDDVKGVWAAICRVFSAAWELIQTVWNAVKPYYAAIWAGIKAVFAAVAPVLGGFFKTAWEAIKGVWAIVGPYFKVIWEGIKAVFSVVGAILGGFFKTAWTAIKAVWNVAVSFFKAIFNTIAGIFSAVTALFKGDFSGAWEAIRGIASSWGAFFGTVWESIKAVFGAVVSWFGGIFSSAWEAIKGSFSNAVSFYQGIWEKIKAVFGAVVSWFGGIFSSAWEAIKGSFSNAVSFYQGIWEKIKAVFGAVVSWFGGIFSSAWEAIKGAFSAVGDFFKGVWDTIVGLFTSIGTAVGDAISGAVKKAINAVLSGAVRIINGFISAINVAIGVINAIPGVNIGKISALEVPQLATGGIVTSPTILEAGEGGEPEAVLPLSKLSTMLQGIGGPYDGIMDAGNQEDSQEAPLAQLAKRLDKWGGNPEQGTPWPNPDSGNEKDTPTDGQNQPDGVDTITFAPVFNFYGQTTKEEAEEAGRISFAEFKRLYQQMKAEERRKNLRAATH